MTAIGWILAVASLAGVWLNIRRDRRCFALWIGTNASWCALDIGRADWPRAALMAVYVTLAVHGWRSWRVA